MKKKIRLIFVLIGAAAFLMSYTLGGYTKLDESSALKLKQDFMHKVTTLNYLGIFTNNLLICLLMFIPGLGILFGLFSGYSTGTIFSAIIHTSQNTNATQISPLLILLTPFGIMEVFCYGLAISRSYLLLISLIKRNNILQQFKLTLIEITIIAIILFVAAIVEWYFLGLYGGAQFKAFR